MKKNSIHIIPSAEIDSTKWNEKIAIEKNGLIYSTTTYLNTLTDYWCGIVVNDYEVIAAVPFRKKGFIHYCYTPNFIQQLGLIGPYNQETAKEIIGIIKKKFHYGSLQFNFSNNPSLFFETYVNKKNFIVQLNQPFEAIAMGFRKDLKVNLEKSKYQLFDYIKSIDCKTAIEIYKSQNGAKMKNINTRDFQKLMQYCNKDAQKKEDCFTRAIVNADDEILAIALLLKDEKRLYNIANTVTSKGRALFANHLLINNIIEEFSRQELLFDFEGSTILGIAAFYSAFGATQETYFTHHYNNLPFPLSMIR
ncbi:MAG: hypothetical protein EAZ12_03410 [Sphingobacteriia bacterium]|nr:MAG: hypothetical protein EAZ12_03410 [Sphingobacteriia bacterium]